MERNKTSGLRQAHAYNEYGLCVVHFLRVRVENGNVESLERYRTAGWIIARDVPLGVGDGIIRLTMDLC
jgi:hypothetical protein